MTQGTSGSASSTPKEWVGTRTHGCEPLARYVGRPAASLANSGLPTVMWALDLVLPAAGRPYLPNGRRGTRV